MFLLPFSIWTNLFEFVDQIEILGIINLINQSSIYNNFQHSQKALVTKDLAAIKFYTTSHQVKTQKEKEKENSQNILLPSPPYFFTTNKLFLETILINNDFRISQALFQFHCMIQLPPAFSFFGKELLFL